MHHHKTYMYIDFQQNRVSRSVKSVHTKLFAKKSEIKLKYKIKYINLQLAIRFTKVTPFAPALPHNRHSD